MPCGLAGVLTNSRFVSPQSGGLTEVWDLLANNRMLQPSLGIHSDLIHKKNYVGAINKQTSLFDYIKSQFVD